MTTGEMPGLDAGQTAWLESRGVTGPFRVVGGGFRTNVFESAEGYMVRMGKSPASDNTFSTERRVMDSVRTRVDVAVPRPTILEDDLSEFPHGLMVYPKLAGAAPSAPSPALERSAASVLRQLHTMVTDFDPPDRAVGPDGLETLVRLTRPSLTEGQGRAGDRWLAHVRRFLARAPALCLIHGDFWQANWLVTTDGTITGLLDFERSGLGLPHEDLAPLRYLGERFRDAALDAYCEGTDQDPASLREEVRLFDVLRELRGLGWALRYPEAGEVDDAVEKVAGVLARYV